MKYKRYILSFKGDPEAVVFLKQKAVSGQYSSLGQARRLGRAAETLFEVDDNVASVTVPRATADRVRSL